MADVTLLPDTNIWRYLVDAGAVEPVRRAAKQQGVRIVACPAVVYECLRVGDPQLRGQLAKALTHNDWLRPMPEAFLEAEDVRAEIARLHPEWMIEEPDLHTYRINRQDWRAGFWRRVRNQPKLMASVLSDLEGGTLNLARDQAKSARATARMVGHNTQSLNLATARAWFGHPVRGWDGTPFEAWRALSQAHWWEAVVLGYDTTASDWLGDWLDLRRIRKERDVWVHMWTREAAATRLPREWMRWAMKETQALRKVTPGTPVDNQIATYLLDFDVFVTSDRAFRDCIQHLLPHAPASLARVELAPANAASVDFLVDLLDRLGAKGCP